ncbi:putative bifunctional diguanylate cyclase/phosphodiesterase [Noviherbaspirillum soli]|uniref:putative bifunctional diguanylate cyclase/phosphodiesterase n=1 Tax=Noviherbaspirillum soli TaxID=1064518 RepID=UPI00188C0D9D|nr:EAL domain-containing protein [Noviherbaspirillum soli]
MNNNTVGVATGTNAQAEERTLAVPRGLVFDGGDSTDTLRKARILMVDDEPITLEVMRDFLEEAGYANLYDTSEPEQAMPLIAAEAPDLVLLDLMMPVVNGFDILSWMRADERHRHIPVIVLTSSTNAATKLKALELGATDFLAKPVDASELALRIRNTLAAKVHLDRLAYIDSLTGLPNRRMFQDHLDWALSQAQRHERVGALMHINVDHFKKVNEALGPAVADALLQQIGQRLEYGVRDCDSVGRIGRNSLQLSRVGGDEFAVLLSEMARVDDAIGVARRLLESVRAPFQVAGHELFVSCSIGVAVFPGDGMERNALLQNAGVAMHSARQQGGNAWRFYSSDLNQRSLQSLGLQSDLHKAIERGELRLYFQPKVCTATGGIVGAEALIRWQHPERGFIRPDDFIPLAEENGLIVPIGAWVIAEACRRLRAWHKQGLSLPRISVNVSGRQFGAPGFYDSVRATLEVSGVDARCLTFEVTESILMENADESIALLKRFKAMGLKLSMDDFGTGYSSLSYLRRFPLDELKIDRSFLAELDDDGTEGKALITAIIVLGHSLGLSIVAEGVETETQLALLRELGCDECQGFLFSRPVAAEEFERLLAAH